MRIAITLGLLMMAFTATVEARLILVRCCIPRHVDRLFSRVMGGPGPVWEPHGADMTGTCVFGFDDAPDSAQLRSAMCYPGPLPNHAGSYCTQWWDESVYVDTWCWGDVGAGIHTYILFDFDGDGDVDLADFAEFQNAFEVP